MDYKKFQQYEQRALSTVYEEGDTFHNDIIPVLTKKYLSALNVPTDAKILDIGCGPGQFLQTARDLGYVDVTGVTLSAEDLLACEQLSFKTIKSDMSDLPVDDASVDFIWCRQALEHSPYPLFTLFEFHRVLKPNGQLYVEVPAPDNERIMLGEYNANHYSILGQNMWLSLFVKSGFTVTISESYGLDIDQMGKIWKEKSFVFGLTVKS